MTAMQQVSRNIVLVVDDSAQTVAMLADVLENAGSTALVAMRGERALDIARQVTPDVILLDAVMPGMDGFETCRRLKRDDALSHVPVIFMTGLADTDDVVRGLEAGGVDYVTKPIEPKELLARIRVHLANARTAHGARSALDSAGRFLFATDERGRLLWWTPQAGRLIGELVPEGLAVGAELPERVRRLIDGGGDVSIEAPGGGGPSGKPATALQIALVGHLSQGEYLMRVAEIVTGEPEAILRDRLSISGREAQVLTWIAQGKSNRDIAEILNLSPRTVNKHLERIFRKIGVENRTSAAAVALKHVGGG